MPRNSAEGCGICKKYWNISKTVFQSGWTIELEGFQTGGLWGNSKWAAYWSFTRCVTCKCFLSDCGLSSHRLKRFLVCFANEQTFYLLIRFNLSFFFMFSGPFKFLTWSKFLFFYCSKSSLRMLSLAMIPEGCLCFSNRFSVLELIDKPVTCTSRWYLNKVWGHFLGYGMAALWFIENIIFWIFVNIILVYLWRFASGSWTLLHHRQYSSFLGLYLEYCFFVVSPGIG